MPESEHLPLERVGRLQLEEERLWALPSFMFRLSEFDAALGFAKGCITYDSNSVDIAIEFGQEFPYQRPILRTQDKEVIGYRHVNREGQICTLRHQPEEWEPERHTASFLIERAWKLIANKGELNEEDDHLPQPLDFDFQGINHPVFLAPEDAAPGAETYGWSNLLPSLTALQGFVLVELQDSKHQMVWQDKSEGEESRYADNKSERVICPWFATDKAPPYKLEELEDLEGLMPEGVNLNKLAASFRIGKLKNGWDYHVLIRYSDETGSRWAFVQISERRERNSERVTKLHYLPSYTIGPDAFFGRIDGLVDRQRLADAHAVIIGMGALGSEIGYQLSRSGLGHLTTFDGDTVTTGNPVRSALDFFWLGMGKVFASKFMMERHLPFTKVTSIGLATSTREGRDRLEQVLEDGDVDLVIVAIGNHQASRSINALLSKYEVPKLYTWTTRGVAAGVVLTTLSEEANFETYHNLVMSNEVPHLPEVSETEIPNVPERGCAIPVLPGTPVDISTVALQAARTATEVLQGIEPAFYQYWIKKAKSWFDLSLEELASQQDEVKGACPEHQVSQINLSYTARITIEHQIRKEQANETGGVLLGALKGNELDIDWASGPGDASLHTTISFVLNTEYAQGCIDTANDLSNGRLRFFGEWHSHPSGSLSPSQNDLRALKRLALSQHANIDVPIIVIAVLDKDGELVAEAYTYSSVADHKKVRLNLKPFSSNS